MGLSIGQILGIIALGLACVSLGMNIAVWMIRRR